MNVGLFAMLAGFLLPASLAARLFGQIVLDRDHLWNPLTLWRGQILFLLFIPILAGMPAVAAVFTARPSATGAIIMQFAETPTGLKVLLAKIVGVLFVDAVSPRVTAQLERFPMTEAAPSRAYLARDVGVICICLALAWVATWWSEA